MFWEMDFRCEQEALSWSAHVPRSLPTKAFDHNIQKYNTEGGKSGRSDHMHGKTEARQGGRWEEERGDGQLKDVKALSSNIPMMESELFWCVLFTKASTTLVIKMNPYEVHIGLFSGKPPLTAFTLSHITQSHGSPKTIFYSTRREGPKQILEIFIFEMAKVKTYFDLHFITPQDAT